MKKIFMFLSSVLFLLTIIITVMPQDVMASSMKLNNGIFMEQTLRSDIIEWRYKTENGKLYKRLYNYSKQEWIGEWELY